MPARPCRIMSRDRRRAQIEPDAAGLGQPLQMQASRVDP